MGKYFPDNPSKNSLYEYHFELIHFDDLIDLFKKNIKYTREIASIEYIGNNNWNEFESRCTGKPKKPNFQVNFNVNSLKN